MLETALDTPFKMELIVHKKLLREKKNQLQLQHLKLLPSQKLLERSPQRQKRHSLKFKVKLKKVKMKKLLLMKLKKKKVKMKKLLLMNLKVMIKNQL